MADNAASSQEDDLSLPRAAVYKMIKEMIPNIRISNDARELFLNCCTEFIHLIASESNEICNKQTKKTISPDHVIAALDSLGFQDYVKDVEGVLKQFKTQAQTRKQNNKLKNQGVPEEELLRQQQELFAKARAEQAQEDWLQMQQQQRLATGSPVPPAGQPIPCMNQQLLGKQTTMPFIPGQPQQQQLQPMQQVAGVAQVPYDNTNFLTTTGANNVPAVMNCIPTHDDNNTLHKPDIPDT